MKHRTAAYWLKRIMLAAAILVPVAVVVIWLWAPQSTGPPLHDHVGWDESAIFAVGVALWLVGVVWMLRIFRGPRDEAPAWRYRDR